MSGDFASRLRQLRDNHGWTVAEMAYRTGVPKRTLDKYLLREGASLPGFDALIAISRGLGVSIDWLVLGTDVVGENTDLLADRCARDASLPVFEALLRHHHSAQRPLVEGEMILGLSPDEWAADVGARAGEVAKALIERGVTTEDLKMWRHNQGERLWELVEERARAVREGAK